MFETLAGFLSSLRQTSPIIFLGLCIASGSILFVGDDLAKTLGLSEFRDQNRGYLVAAFIITLSILIAQGIWGSGRFLESVVKKRWENRKLKQVIEDRKKCLHNLTPDEKAYLAPYVLRDENTQYFLIEDGIAGGLEAKGIIYQASIVGNMLDGFAYNIQPWAREYLKENSHLLLGASPSPRSPRNW
jgi:hypothetical protein